jgi:hypothetical protein
MGIEVWSVDKNDQCSSSLNVNDENRSIWQYMDCFKSFLDQSVKKWDIDGNLLLSLSNNDNNNLSHILKKLYIAGVPTSIDVY